MSRIHSPAEEPALGAVAAKPDACRCHEDAVPEHVESPGCQCHKEAARDLAAAYTTPRLAVAEAIAANRVEKATPAQVFAKPAQQHRGARWLRASLAAGFVLVAAALIVTALTPVVLVGIVLALTALSPFILWAMFVFATLDVDLEAAQDASSGKAVAERGRGAVRFESAMSR